MTAQTKNQKSNMTTSPVKMMTRSTLMIYTKVILLWLRWQESHALHTTLTNVHGGQTIKTEGAAVCDRDSKSPASTLCLDMLVKLLSQKMRRRTSHADQASLLVKSES